MSEQIIKDGDILGICPNCESDDLDWDGCINNIPNEGTIEYNAICNNCKCAIVETYKVDFSNIQATKNG